MRELNKKTISALALLAFAAGMTIASPSKRGICYNDLNLSEVTALTSGNVSWGYNWYVSDYRDGIGTDKFLFAPMMWGGGEDFEERLSLTDEYLTKHPEAKYLLGFNEPMMKNAYGGCDMTPHTAALLWPQVEALAEKHGVSLVSPALTWGFEPLTEDGKIYVAPEDWFNQWIDEYKKLYEKEPRFDYLALHSYMDYPSAVMWFCDTYYDMYKKPILLTEFCAWESENHEPHKTALGQLESMSQKVESLDANEHVAGYNWFMSHASVDKIPFNSIFKKKGADGTMTELGWVYVHQSTLNKEKYFSLGETIPAYAYASSSNYNETLGEKPQDGARFETSLGVRRNTDKKTLKTIPLELSCFRNGRFANYQIESTSDGDKKLTLRYMSDGEETIYVFVDGEKVLRFDLPIAKKWKENTVTLPLASGKHTLMLKSEGGAKNVKLVTLKIE